MAAKDIGKYSRTSKEQIDCYLSFLDSHPEMKLNKNDPTDPKRMERLWVELSEVLNALRGPSRTPTKWKESFTHWKNQIRSRARKTKASRLVTGGGPLLEEDISNVEQRALETMSAVVIDGAQDIPTVGTESAIIITCDPISPAVEENEPMEKTPTTSRRSKAATSEDMFRDVMTAIKKRNDDEKIYRDESLKCMSELSASMTTMASAVLALTQARANRD